MRKKELRIFLLMLSAWVLVICALAWYQYDYQRDYQAALENSNFIQWSHAVTAEDVEYAGIRCGYGADTVKYHLSPEEIQEACQILNDFPVEDLSLTNDGKGYSFLSGQDADINFFINDGTDEFEFRYRPSNPQELYIRSNSEMGDTFKDLGNRWTTNEALLDFILTHAPTK